MWVNLLLDHLQVFKTEEVKTSSTWQQKSSSINCLRFLMDLYCFFWTNMGFSYLWHVAAEISPFLTKCHGGMCDSLSGGDTQAWLTCWFWHVGHASITPADEDMWHMPPSDIFWGRRMSLLKQVIGRKNPCLIERKIQIQQSSCLNLMTWMTENLHRQSIKDYNQDRNSGVGCLNITPPFFSQLCHFKVLRKSVTSGRKRRRARLSNWDGF